MPCVNERVAELFSMWKLKIQPVIDLYKSPISEEASVRILSWVYVSYKISSPINCELLWILWATVH